MFKKAHFIGVIVVVLVVAVLLKLPPQTMGKFKLAISGLFLPLFGLASSSHDVAEKTGNMLVSKRELFEQNKRLQQENQQLRLLLTRDAELERENERLRQSIGWKKQVAAPMKLGRVIAHDPANWWRSVQIDLGARMEFVSDLPARTVDGLVGRVHPFPTPIPRLFCSVTPTFVSPRLSERQIARPASYDEFDQSAGKQHGRPRLPSGQQRCFTGQTVTTSGDGGVFPPAIPIGRIVDKRSRDNGLTSEARVQLFANLAALEEVWVLMPASDQTHRRTARR